MGVGLDEPIYGDSFSQAMKTDWGFSFLGMRRDGGESHAFNHEISPLNMESKDVDFLFSVAIKK